MALSRFLFVLLLVVRVFEHSRLNSFSHQHVGERIALERGTIVYYFRSAGLLPENVGQSVGWQGSRGSCLPRFNYLNARLIPSVIAATRTTMMMPINH